MSPFRRKILPVLAGALLAAAAPAGWAFDDRWSVSFTLGGHVPGLSHLDDGLYRSSFLGTASVLIREGGGGGGEGEDANETESIPFRYENDLDPVRVAPVGGIELAWHPNERHSFIFAFGGMEHVSSSRTVGNLPVQQYFVSNIVEGERRGKISFTEYTLGWRYNMLRRDRFRLYSRLTVHEVFDIDYREEWTFLFTESPINDLVGVRRNMVTEASSASIFMGQLGLGGEWFITDRFSVGLEGGYILGDRKFSLRDAELRDDFTAGDALTRSGLPFRVMPDGTLGFLSPDATVDDVESIATRDAAYIPMRLAFDGWRIGLKLNIYF